MQCLDDLSQQFPPVVTGPGLRRGDEEMDCDAASVRSCSLAGRERLSHRVEGAFLPRVGASAHRFFLGFIDRVVNHQ